MAGVGYPAYCNPSPKGGLMSVLPFARSADPVVHAALETRRIAREQVHTELATCKQGTPRWKTSKHLLDLLEGVSPKGSKTELIVNCISHVEQRLERLRSTNDETLGYATQRDLRIILLFGAGKLPREMLLDVFAIMHLRGSVPNKILIAEAFPGFLDAVR